MILKEKLNETRLDSVYKLMLPKLCIPYTFQTLSLYLENGDICDHDIGLLTDGSRNFQ